MPWKEIKPMDEKILFIADHLRGHFTMTALCERYGISRKTGYKWLERYQQQGMEGLNEQPRRPHQNPLATPYTIRQAIIELRTQTRVPLGAKKIRAKLAQRFPNEPLPSKSTIYNILNQAGLVTPRKHRQRVPPCAQPFSPVHTPNELWSADFKGQFLLRNGIWCYPLTVMDHHSRYLLGCDGKQQTTFTETKNTFIHLFEEFGLPQRIRTDNGSPFASKSAGGLSRLSIWWVKLGIRPERIEPGKPQQNGRHERMHRTLKQATTHPPAANLSSQQRCFNEFIDEYNEQRPHEALKQKTPASVYQRSPRVYTNTLTEPNYPDYFEKYTVRSSGVVYSNNGQIYISNLLKNETVGMEQISDGIWDVYFGPVRLGGFDIRDKKGKNTPYWTIKV